MYFFHFIQFSSTRDICVPSGIVLNENLQLFCFTCLVSNFFWMFVCQVLNALTLRRSTQDVATQLPNLEETILPCLLSSRQRRHYMLLLSG